jgi:hypothetical protein
VDVLAINWRTNDILLGECKWEDNAVDKSVIRGLLGKTERVLPGETAWRIHYAFFARHGFTPAAQALAQEHSAQLVTLAEMDSDMQRWLQVQAAR